MKSKKPPPRSPGLSDLEMLQKVNAMLRGSISNRDAELTILRQRDMAGNSIVRALQAEVAQLTEKLRATEDANICLRGEHKRLRAEWESAINANALLLARSKRRDESVSSLDRQRRQAREILAAVLPLLADAPIAPPTPIAHPPFGVPLNPFSKFTQG